MNQSYDDRRLPLVMEKKKMVVCDFCEEDTATVLCPECSMCYCNKCSEFTHNITAKKGHKRETIPKGVDVKAMCPIHKKIPLELFCIDEVKLCCSTCMMENLHKGHKVSRLSGIICDNGTFSAAEVRDGYKNGIGSADALNKKIKEIIESINKDITETKGSIKKTFEEEHKKLEDEEKRLMKELEEEYNNATGPLHEFKTSIEEALKDGKTLDGSYAEKMKCGCDRLMELNIVSEMGKQLKEIEKLLKTEMRGIKVSWNEKARKLSFTKNLFNGVPAVRNVTAKSITWNTITLTWEADEGASSYQVEMDGNKQPEAIKTNTYTKFGLSPNTEHKFRVKSVKGDSEGEWSGVVKGRTQKESLGTSGWKACPDSVDASRKYNIDEKNPRIVTKIGNVDAWCTIIGNTPVPKGTIASWSIKVLKSKNNDGSYIFIGVAPSDINQNEDDNSDKCGWYYNCYASALWSGPPHNYSGKVHGPRKEKGTYMGTGSSVGVVMDTAKGELSFIVNGVNCGVAFEGIPLDKPLVPCVILKHSGDSIEFIM